jgi:hypothetical protein
VRATEVTGRPSISSTSAPGSHVVRWTRSPRPRRRLGPGTVSATNANRDRRSSRSAAAERWLMTAVAWDRVEATRGDVALVDMTRVSFGLHVSL